MADQVAEGLLSPLLRGRRIRAARPQLRGRVLDVGCGTGALAAWVPADRYVGVERDEPSLEIARRSYPQHRFYASLAEVERDFDTIVALAVIEHVENPEAFLRELAARLASGSESSIICTTPHPAMGWAHAIGAKVGLFSWHASEEHQPLLNRRRLHDCGAVCGLRLAVYRRFLLGANQLAGFRRAL